jgi:1-acyl-sn-glycerol-3-phosphate acyltransferase
MGNLSKLILKIAGWHTVTTLPEPHKSVVCVAPHTSNWDYIMGQLFYWSEGRQSAFMIKKSWFVFPFGLIFRKLGGVPVDKTGKQTVTKTVVDMFRNRDKFHIAITPEGTRKRVKRWKSGFYQIAKEANVPIQLAYIDYKKKEIAIKEIIFPSEDEKADFQRIYDYFRDVTACHPENFYLPAAQE